MLGCSIRYSPAQHSEATSATPHEEHICNSSIDHQEHYFTAPLGIRRELAGQGEYSAQCGKQSTRDSPCAVHVAFAGQAPSLKHLTICSHLSTFTAHLPFLPMINHKPAHAASACNASRFGSVLHMLLQMVVGNLGATGGGYFAERLGIAKTC